MQKIRTLIVEDNEEEAKFLKEHLEHKNFSVMGIENTIEGALASFSSNKIDFLIINVFLNEKPDGITVAKEISKDKKAITPFIFLTDSSERSIFEKANLTYSYSYLLKPFNELELEYAIELCIEKYSTHLRQLKEVETLPFFLKWKDVFFKLTVEDILFLETEGRYCKINDLDNNKFLLKYSLSELFGYLPSKDFIQIHRNFIVNINYIEHVSFNDNLLYLNKHGLQFRIGRAYKGALLERYNIPD